MMLFKVVGYVFKKDNSYSFSFLTMAPKVMMMLLKVVGYVYKEDISIHFHFYTPI